jgi:hypothetical protein
MDGLTLVPGEKTYRREGNTFVRCGRVSVTEEPSDS